MCGRVAHKAKDGCFKEMNKGSGHNSRGKKGKGKGE